MRQKINKNLSSIIWIVMILVMGNIGLLSRFFSPSADDANQAVTEDIYMTTTQYDVAVQVNEDNSYTISEDIDVEYDTYRHGIYRYIPYKGIITEAEENGELTDIPYYATINRIKSEEPLAVSSENGNKVLRFGSEDVEVIDAKNYQFTYHVAPVTSDGYENAYWNIYPTGWRNEIPPLSSFAITFPKDFPKEKLVLYTGKYGEQNNAAEFMDFKWEGNTFRGTLLKALPVGHGLTFQASMEPGYFVNPASTHTWNVILIAITLIIFIVLLILFWLFGRDDKIIPSIQFQPPEGMDSAAVGYIIDGSPSNEDIISLFIYWADQGFIKIRENGEKELGFTKLKELPKDTPKYAKTLFNAVFSTESDSIGKEVLTKDMQYRLADAFSTTKRQLQKHYKGLYTTSSRIARVIGTILAVIPLVTLTIVMMNVAFTNVLILVFAILYLVGIVLFNKTVDTWYSLAKKNRRIWSSGSAALSIVPLVILLITYGAGMLRGTQLNLLPALICIVIVSIAFLFLVGFMKKRTAKCVGWMGYLVGLRDFIETAELERMKVIAKDSPHLFYHILPFAYVFGISDILMSKMENLALPWPDWYETGATNPYFQYYLMHRMLYTDMKNVSTTISTPQPTTSSSNAAGGFSGGGFSGGGFSGGGFGGGGGGSW